MVYKLYLLRHGQAQPYGSHHHDFDRELTAQGRLEIAQIAQWMKSEGHNPHRVVASNAIRTIQSAEIAAGIFETPINNFWGEIKLYNAEVEEYLHEIHSQPESIPSIMMVGHNPTISDLAMFLTGKDVGLSTGGLAIISQDSKHWRELGHKTAHLDLQLKPSL